MRRWYLVTAVCAGLGLGWWALSGAEPAVADAVATAAPVTPGAAAVVPAQTAPAVAAAEQPVVARSGEDEAAASQRLRRQQDQAYWHQRLDGYRQPGGNLQQFFAELLAQCGGEPDLCQALLEQRLAEYPNQAFADRLRRILARQPAYQQTMQSLVMSTEVPAQTRYQRIDALREQHFGAQDAELLYGQERAWADYQFGFQTLLAEAPYLSPAQRLQQLQALRQRSWQDYPQALAQREGDQARYRRERDLLLAGVDDPDQRQALVAGLREQHFGAERARRMAARDHQLAQQQAQQQHYQQAREALTREMTALRGQMSDSVWQQQYQQRLQQLREEAFAEPDGATP
ncbi:lipase chaperone [Marinobacter sp. CA1]|uniref:lipase chaperone n=1 Tax=Marinobacter sp. CA1 TaxID=2817656 RepID=UPI001D06E312|nr:lipase chaperone [Marinobacter sp. CA1]UDL05372.1 hypothetical protein J2887_00910 [Marinobacter sp. CA1]